MLSTLAAVLFLVPSTITIISPKKPLFNKNQVIFTSHFNISSILVPADGNKYIDFEPSDIPSIFFTVVASHFDGGSCIYVLEDLTAFELLEGGRDSTADYGSDRNVYFGAKDGIYRYDRESLSAKKHGPFKDNIIQIQKANGTDTIYYLTKEHKMFKVERNGTIRTKLKYIVCATQFVLDTANNIYYVECKVQMIRILKADGTIPNMLPVADEFLEVKLLRPAFIMDNSIPFFGDGTLHILYSNATFERKDFVLTEKPSAFSVDAALYLVAVLNGKIYEYNVMDVLVKSMFGLEKNKPEDVSKIVLSLIRTPQDNIFGYYKA